MTFQKRVFPEVDIYLPLRFFTHTISTKAHMDQTYWISYKEKHHILNCQVDTNSLVTCPYDIINFS